MHWLDYTRAAAAMGLGVAHPPIAPSERLPGLRPFMATPRVGTGATTPLQAVLDGKRPWALTLQGDGTGFDYQVEDGKVFVQFRYPRNIELDLDELSLSPAGELRRYTEVLPIVRSELGEFARHLALSDVTQVVNRVGVVALAPLSRDNLPAGIAAWLHRLVPNGATGVADGTLRVGATLPAHERGNAHCVAQIQFAAGDNAKLMVTFDWQLVLDAPMPLEDAALDETLALATDSALAAFATFAE